MLSAFASAGEPHGLRVRLFGEPQIEYGGQPVAEKLPERVVTLLAYLLLHAGEDIPRHRLASTLSPEVADDEARADLRRRIFVAHRLLPNEPPSWFTVSARDVGWNVDAPYWLDVDDFQRLSNNAESQRAACELYTSDLLNSYADEWLEPIRRRLRVRYMETLAALARRGENEGS
jgi:DNA-binding SARP family transcriptional activator